MKAMKVLGAVLAIGLGLSVVGSSSDVLAQAKNKSKQAAPPSVAAEPPDAKKTIGIPFANLAWGMSHKKVAEVMDAVIDADYKPKYKAGLSAPALRALDAQVIEDKSAFRRSRIDFGKLPTGVDSTPLKGEYTYLNKESLMSITLDGKTTHFFFIQDKLWKIIAEHKLGGGHKLGNTFQEAVLKLVKQYGVPGRVQEADYEKGRNATEVDWKDTTTHVRAIERGETAIGLAYEDRATLANLTALRPNKPVVTDDIDPAVAAAIRGSKAPEPPPAPPADKNKKK